VIYTYIFATVTFTSIFCIHTFLWYWCKRNWREKNHTVYTFWI